MKAKILIVLSITLLISINMSGFVFADDNCEVARPYYGSITCEEKTSLSDPIIKKDGEIYACPVPNCEIEGFSSSFSCSPGYGHGLEIFDIDTNYTYVKCESGIGIPWDCSLDDRTFHKDIKLKVDFYCHFWGDIRNPTDSPQVTFKYNPIALKLKIDSGSNFYPNTEFCNINEIWTNFQGHQLENNNILKDIPVISGIVGPGDGLSTIPTDYDQTLQPNDLEADQGYWLVYDWVTRPDLIVSYMTGNVPVWCNIIDHSLTKFEEVTTRSGSCYLMPSTRLQEKAECCSSDECKVFYSEQSIVCTDDFKCGYEKSCLSDYDCSGILETCQEEGTKYFLVKPSCDKSKLDAYGNGKCSTSKEEVKCCTGDDGGPDICGSGNFCKYDEGCVKILLNCPSGMCCKSGGDYKPQDCTSGLECCLTPDPVLGECKLSCGNESSLTQGGGSSDSTESTPLSYNLIEQGFPFAILVIIIVAAVGIYYLNNKGYINLPIKSKTTAHEPAKAKKPEKKKIAKSETGFCPYCGSKLEKDDSFCPECGGKV